MRKGDNWYKKKSISDVDDIFGIKREAMLFLFSQSSGACKISIVNIENIYLSQETKFRKKTRNALS